MTTIIVVATVFAIVPAAAVRYGVDSRDLVHRDPRSLLT